MNKLRIELSTPLKPSDTKLPELKQSRKYPVLARKGSITDQLSSEKRLLKRAKAMVASKPNEILRRWSSFATPQLETSGDDYLEESYPGMRKNTFPTISVDELASPRIRLKVIDVKNVNPIGHEGRDPTDENVIRELEAKVHSSVVKRYQVVIPKKLELPVINSALASRRFQSRHPSLQSVSETRDDASEQFSCVDNQEAQDLKSTKSTREISKASSISSPSAAIEEDESTSGPSSSSSSSQKRRLAADFKSITIGLFDSYAVGSNKATAAALKSTASATEPCFSFAFPLGSSASRKTSLRRMPVVNSGQKSEIKKYFCHKVRLVIALIKILEFAAQKAEFTKAYFKMAALGTDYISEIVQESFNQSNNEDQIVFNKDFYKAKKETEVGKEMQYALTIPPEARTQEQIKMVRLGLNRLDSFIEYPIYMQEKICRCAFYQKVPAKRVIIRQGQIADSFYFIVSGQAMVTILEDDKITNETKNRIVAILKDGTCFGELAFLYNTTRTATVTSLTAMELISIGRQDFYDIFMAKRGEEPDHVRFLRSCPFFEFWPVHVLLQNPQYCMFHYYKKGQIITKNSIECEYIYIIKSGTCQVLKRLDEVRPRRLKPRPSTSSASCFLQDVYQSKVDTGLRNHNSSSKDASIPWAFTSIDDLNRAKSEPRSVFLQIQLLKEGDSFGLNTLKFDESDRNIPNPELSLISNGSEVVMVRKDVFLKNADTRVRNNIRYLVQPYPESEAMQEKLQNKADWVHFKKKLMNELKLSQTKLPLLSQRPLLNAK